LPCIIWIRDVKHGYQTVKLIYRQYYANTIFFTPVFQQVRPVTKFLCSTFGIDKRLSVSLLSLNYDTFSHRFQCSRLWRMRLNAESKQTRKLQTDSIQFTALVLCQLFITKL
jgi:hypothetical protein